VEFIIFTAMIERLEYMVLGNVSKVLLLFGILMVTACAPTEKNETTSGESRDLVIPDKVDFNYHVRPILSDRCYTCHGPDEGTREAGLRLDLEEAAFIALGENKDHHAIVKGDAKKSTLIERIYTDNKREIMPPPESNLILEAHEKAILKRWIEQGAEWKTHWSFIPPVKSDLPEVADEDWPINEIDHFVLAKLESQDLVPKKMATKEQLIRRLTFDLTGLSPSLEEIDNFLEDENPDAYEKVVDRLLASNAYAEHMTTQWLDIARYADTHGYQDDLERIMWPWRDWVIHAFKKNMPYDQFVKWQLAGDLLPDATKEQILATGFNRNHKITQEGGVIDEEYRVEYVADRTQTFATAFLGLTVECARCHDHKYDPIAQKDFFSLFGFFNSVPEKGVIGYDEIPEPKITLTQKEIDEVFTFINNVDTLEEIEVMVMADNPRQAYILNRGAYDQPTTPVATETPPAVLPFPEDLPRNRLGLADWLTLKENPLTARVAVNRFWQQLFGNGIVGTSNDFGNQGALPTHPELLDWLSIKFVEENWDVRAILKCIVNSATYRQNTKISPEMLELDPQNSYLARAPRLRLSAEMMRDHFLSISGLLVKDIGGPSVKPYQPPGLWSETTGGGGGSTAKYVEGEGSALYRRSLYTFWKRTVPPPSMITFDAASRDNCTVKRQRTSTPLQALVLMNDPQIIEAARVIAYRSIEEAKPDLASRIDFIFRLATSRFPASDEQDALRDYFEEELVRFQKDEDAAKALLSNGDYPQKDLLDLPEMAAYTILASTIFNLDEAITKG